MLIECNPLQQLGILIIGIVIGAFLTMIITALFNVGSECERKLMNTREIDEHEDLTK